jgi:hypothetical protein
MPTSAVVVFREGGLDPILVAIEAEVAKHVPDLTTAKGRKEIKSLAYKVTRSKTYLDELGKNLNEDAHKSIDAVNAERNRMKERLETLKDSVTKPLDTWEEIEAKRVLEIRKAIDRFHQAPTHAFENAAQISDQIAAVKDLPDSEAFFGEFAGEASMAREVALKTLEAMLEKQQKHDKDMAELEALRKADEERQAKEAEAEKKAKQEEKQRLAEQQQKEREEAERLAREQAVQQAKEQAERAAQEREAQLLADNERMQQEAKQREERLLADAKRREEEAVRLEREKVERQQREDAAERKRREENTRIRNNTKRNAVEAMMKWGVSLTVGEAEILFDAIDAGKIPKISIHY